MRCFNLVALLLFCCIAGAQKETYDIISFTPPKGWKKENLENLLSFSTTDLKTRTWAQVGIIQSTSSKGSISTDFKSEWEGLVVKPYQAYGVSKQPLNIDSQTVDGWKVNTGLGTFVFNKDTAVVLLTTFSDGVRCTSLRMMSNSTKYESMLDDFLASVSVAAPGLMHEKKESTLTTTSTPSGTNFQFNTTNFDDGWTSVVKEDWVEATKGNIRVLLHYPRKEDEVYYTQHEERMNVFWNLLVAPRYRNLHNYESHGSNLPESAYFAGGQLVESATGKEVWVTLFSKGKSGWIEIITPDKESFVKAFGIENPHPYFTEWNALLNLAGMNRFAVGENDLTGKWSNNFTGSTAYYNIYTGLYSGSTTFASQVNFVFHKDKTYNWDLAMGKSATGTAMKVDQAKAAGTWKLLQNWQIWFSEIERKPKTYNAYFSCIKGGRILWLQDVEYGSYTAYGKVGN